MIALVNYGLGNITAFSNVLKSINVKFVIANTSSELKYAEKIILPGVGAFDWAMSRLEQSGMRDCLDKKVLDEGCPVLGICVGMQIMATKSEEGSRVGLNWLNAEVKKITKPDVRDSIQLPHMGWNNVYPKIGNPLFKNIENNPRFYFLHSYCLSTNDDSCIGSTTEYEGKFVSSVYCKNIFGVQFHPEKSHSFGTQLIKNFTEI